MNDRTRFAKCFIIIVEQCKSWLVVFAENRMKICQRGTTFMTLKEFINASTTLSNDPMIKPYLNKMKNASDLDISALRSIITLGHLLHSGEMKSIGHAGNTIEDYVDRILEIRSNFMHTASANLVEQEYNDYLDEFRDIATRFETENKVSTGCYVNEIEKIHEEPWYTETVEKTFIRYNVYLQIIIEKELPEISSLLGSLSSIQTETRNPIPPRVRRASNVYHEQECLTLQHAHGVSSSVARRAEDAIIPFLGWTIGLAVGILNAPWRALGSVLRFISR